MKDRISRQIRSTHIVAPNGGNKTGKKNLLEDNKTKEPQQYHQLMPYILLQSRSEQQCSALLARFP